VVTHIDNRYSCPHHKVCGRFSFGAQNIACFLFAEGKSSEAFPLCATSRETRGLPHHPLQSFFPSAFSKSALRRASRFSKFPSALTKSALRRVAGSGDCSPLLPAAGASADCNEVAVLPVSLAVLFGSAVAAPTSVASRGGRTPAAAAPFRFTSTSTASVRTFRAAEGTARGSSAEQSTIKARDSARMRTADEMSGGLMNMLQPGCNQAATLILFFLHSGHEERSDRRRSDELGSRRVIAAATAVRCQNQRGSAAGRSRSIAMQIVDGGGRRAAATAAGLRLILLAPLALVQIAPRVEASFQTPWVTAGTTPRVAELLTDTSVRGSAILRDSQCMLNEGQGSAREPCVLPINANVSLLRRGAGETTGVDVAMDVFPGPSCGYSESAVSYLQVFTCAACTPGDPSPCFSDSDVTYHYPLRGALFRTKTDATVIRIIFPEGFDASQVR